mmetsp:Transcript_86394/g.249278  ORF Transcript_86394/g.249278 Transcript_86394/m.249278 type:complete len:524 (+) Transcript_86394:71-1642(+)
MRDNANADGGRAGAQRKGARRDEAGHGSAGAPITTLMIKNVPRHLTPRTLAPEIEEAVDKHELDFVYLPWDNAAGTNMGYAFANFTTAEAAQKALNAMDGALWKFSPQRRQIKISPAFEQGLAANLLHCAHKIPATADAEICPLVRRDGEEVSFRAAVRLFAKKATSSKKKQKEQQPLQQPPQQPQPRQPQPPQQQQSQKPQQQQLAGPHEQPASEEYQQLQWEAHGQHTHQLQQEPPGIERVAPRVCAPAQAFGKNQHEEQPHLVPKAVRAGDLTDIVAQGLALQVAAADTTAGEARGTTGGSVDLAQILAQTLQQNQEASQPQPQLQKAQDMATWSRGPPLASRPKQRVRPPPGLNMEPTTKQAWASNASTGSTEMPVSAMVSGNTSASRWASNPTGAKDEIGSPPTSPLLGEDLSLPAHAASCRGGRSNTWASTPENNVCTRGHLPRSAWASNPVDGGYNKGMLPRSAWASNPSYPSAIPEQEAPDDVPPMPALKQTDKYRHASLDVREKLFQLLSGLDA